LASPGWYPAPARQRWALRKFAVEERVGRDVEISRFRNPRENVVPLKAGTSA
jgi:hypothetical protein